MNRLNPYTPPPPINRDDRTFVVRNSVVTAGRSMKIGVFTGILAGVIFEISMRIPLPTYVPLMWQMSLPGLIFGVGVAYASRRALPQARKLMLLLFPLLALVAFTVVGMAYEIATSLWTGNYLEFWRTLSIFSLPGVLILGLGCLTIARPKSYRRFALFLLAAALVFGGAPIFVDRVLTTTSLSSLVYFFTMFVSQLIFFALIGWIFGDTRQPIPSPQQKT